ncbi:hypothetical protein BDN70DRAFT_882046 [Pholiota conissans]|uniref:Uncharacterized protein n=1 Tax=Pholiota conissans TaxID=109636 RepID=A0A9P5YVU5_9AGAR|nr:hypothetical protein BDN70DRAFT_882046 [Pholiota conissans]
MADPSPPDQGSSQPTEEQAPKPTDANAVRYPPFPPKPPGVNIIPFKSFKERGIQIFSMSDVEVDGLGIPTVALRVPHNTDKRKSQKKGAKPGDDQKQDEKRDLKGKKKEEPKEKMDPLKKAQEQRKQRIMMFAQKEWYNVWAEGEDLRGAKTYDPSRSSIDRIHIASTEFRTGRVWPPASSQVSYLWDQFRLYAGLLGSPPIWIRTDLPQPEEDDDFDDETDSDVEIAKPQVKKKQLDSDDDDNEFPEDSDDDFSDAPVRKPKQRSAAEVVEQENNRQPNKKRIPTRTPYALYNLDPIPVSSDEEVRKLLGLAAARREMKLLKFLADPEHSTRVFLSWYMRHQGLVWSPTHLVGFPHLLAFFLAFLVRVRALPESERSLRRATEVARRAVLELPRTGKLCRELPDKFGAGVRSIWGKRWEQPKWAFDFGGESAFDDADGGVSAEAREQALKLFEEELKAADVQILPADPVKLGVPPTDLETLSEAPEDDLLVNDEEAAKAAIALETSDIGSSLDAADAVEPGGTAFIEEVQGTTNLKEITTHPLEAIPVVHSGDESKSSDVSMEMPLSAATESASIHTDEHPNWAAAPSVSEPHAPASTFDWSTPTGVSNPGDAEASHNAWAPPATQPLMELFGMTLFPLRYEPGLAERSLRKVKTVFKAGEVDKERKLRGIEEDLASRLARVVLTPWTDWEEGGVAPEYRAPRVQGGPTPGADNEDADQEHKSRYAHDPEKDDITVLVEPHLADMVMVGMGMTGTFVQIVPIRDQSSRSNTGRGRGRGKGRGRGGQPRAGDADDSTADAASVDSTGAARGVFRGKGRGRGGGPSRGAGGDKEFTFWYVEDMYMIVPSFWTVGEEEQPLTLRDLEEVLELDM